MRRMTDYVQFGLRPWKRLPLPLPCLALALRKKTALFHAVVVESASLGADRYTMQTRVPKVQTWVPKVQTWVELMKVPVLGGGGGGVP